MNGNEKQRLVYKILNENKSLQQLEKYNPIVVGTIQINIDIDDCDIDIICEVYDFSQNIDVISKQFTKFENFQVIENNNYIVISYTVKKMTIEIYAERKPTIDQKAYKHLMIEKRLLDIGGEQLRKGIIELKKKGLKTEPAFANYSKDMYSSIFISFNFKYSIEAVNSSIFMSIFL